ncbi:MAG: hypothetical protein ACTHMD_13160 [Flavisolibacter sp.]
MSGKLNDLIADAELRKPYVRRLRIKGLISQHDIENAFVYNLTNYGWTFEGFEAERKRQQKKEILEDEERQSVIDTNKSSKRSNFWSPFFAGLAAFIAFLTFLNELRSDKLQQTPLQQFQQQMKLQDSVLQTLQNRQDSLLRKVSYQDSVLNGLRKPK